MKQIKKKLPIGIENFAKLQSEDFYYVDKTMLIKELLDNWAEVNLFTRPRRFGKTLNMSMLKAFFELNGDRNCFKGTRRRMMVITYSFGLAPFFDRIGAIFDHLVKSPCCLRGSLLS